MKLFEKVRLCWIIAMPRESRFVISKKERRGSLVKLYTFKNLDDSIFVLASSCRVLEAYPRQASSSDKQKQNGTQNSGWLEVGNTNLPLDQAARERATINLPFEIDLQIMRSALCVRPETSGLIKHLIGNL